MNRTVYSPVVLQEGQFTEGRLSEFTEVASWLYTFWSRDDPENVD